MSTTFDVTGISGTTGASQKLVAVLHLPLGIVAGVGTTVTVTTLAGVALLSATVPTGAEAIYIPLDEYADLEYGARCVVGDTALPDTGDRGYEVDVRVVDDATDLESYAAIAAATPVEFAAQRQPYGDAGGPFLISGTWVVSADNNPQSGDCFPRLGAPAGDSVSADVAAVKLKTDNLPASPAAVGSAMVVSDKTGFKLASDGLDVVSTAAPAGVAANFREMIVAMWRRAFKKSTLTATQLKTYADDSTTVITTQVVSNDETTQTQGAAS